MAARLFNPDEEASISLELSGSPFSKMGFRNEIAGICESNLLDLQRFVRTQFLSIPRSSWTVALKDLIACQVTPCLHVTTSGWSGPVVAQAREIAEKLSNQKMDTLDSLNLKLGCAVAAGCLDKHPLIQGVLVAAVEKARRLEKNVQSMKGLQVSSLELAKMSDAGITLSLAAGNKRLLDLFHLAWTCPQLPLSNLHARNLPEAFMAFAYGDVLRTNATIISGLLEPKKKEGEDTACAKMRRSRRRLTLAFDRTYLLQAIDVVQLRCGKGYIGTSFDMSSLNNSANSGDQKTGRTGHFLPLRSPSDVTETEKWSGWDCPSSEGPSCVDLVAMEQTDQKDQKDHNDQKDEDSWDATTLDYAHEMLECVAWDPQFAKLPRFSTCCVPVSYEMSKLDMTILMGKILQQCGSEVRCLTFDNATSHGLIKAFVMGRPHGLSPEQLQQCSFWNTISYQNFPQCALPKWPFRRPMIGGEGLSLDFPFVNFIIFYFFLWF